jgi:hypothetical protein
MKRHLIALLATVLLVVGCAPRASLAGSLAGDTRFTRTGSNLGLTKEEVAKKNGPPAAKEEGGCLVPLFAENGDGAVPVPGDAWMYQAAGEDAQAMLALCFIEGYAVAEKSQWMTKDGERLTVGSTESIDQGLLKKALKDALQSSTQEERRLPQGREIKI